MNRKNLSSAVVEFIGGDVITLIAQQGVNLPPAPFYATAVPPGVYPTTENSEIILVTEKTGDNLTVERAQYGTTEQSIEAQWTLVNGIYAEDLYSIEASVLTKEPAINKSNSPSLGTSNELFPTQAAVKSYVDTKLDEMKQSQYPVGSLYFNATDMTNPATLLGFGTWEAFGAGRVPVGKAATGSFATLGATMGAETHTLTEAQLPNISGNWNLHGQESGSVFYTRAGYATGGTYGSGYKSPPGTSGGASSLTSPGFNFGQGQAHNNIQPSIVVNIWRRTA